MRAVWGWRCGVVEEAGLKLNGSLPIAISLSPAASAYRRGKCVFSSSGGATVCSCGDFDRRTLLNPRGLSSVRGIFCLYGLSKTSRCLEERLEVLHFIRKKGIAGCTACCGIE
ncbi:hypothetical protein AAHA92_04476 [Salvia divinorum]|uniref:Uncharacterized protein n=1 Tax=Salvia divinorum TaxID=28513 RepID=A0ABD1I2K1_SALDI